MRNKYAGICYRCHGNVPAGAGHFERHLGKWRTQHADCAIKAKQQADERQDRDTSAFMEGDWGFDLRGRLVEQ
jgi:hypothetical protein